MLTTDYGVVSLAQINKHAQGYLPNNDRNCQNAFQAFNCLMNSLDDKAKMRINLKQDQCQFVIDGIGHGPLVLLKVIIQTAYVDTKVRGMGRHPAQGHDIPLSCRQWDICRQQRIQTSVEG